MRETLKEQYDKIVKLIKLHEAEYIDNCLKKHGYVIPHTIYELPLHFNRYTKKRPLKFEAIYYSHGIEILTGEKRKPTRGQLAELARYEHEFVLDKIWDRLNILRVKIIYSYEEAGRKVPTYHTIDSLFAGRFVFDEAEYDKKFDELKETYEATQRLIESGAMFYCSQCGKLTESEHKIVSKIINHRQYGPSGREFNFCSHQCAHHYQLGQEG